MEFSTSSTLADEAARELSHRITKQDAKEVLGLTREFFYVREEGKLILVGGLITSDLIASEAYTWIVLRKGEFRLPQIRQGLQIARRYLARQPWHMMCEVAKGDKLGHKFALACGFEWFQDLGDRDLYQWSE
jgi:hypothetical protein